MSEPPAGDLGSRARLRDIEPRDHATVLDLNERNVEALAPMDEDRLAELLGLVDRGDVIDVDGAVAGFVFTFGPEATYDSPNFLAFRSRFGRAFYYLDRIVIADPFRRQGLASVVYAEMERLAAPYGRLALEVNAVPPNVVSLAFHRSRGYQEVGRLGGATAQVALMTKELR